MDDANSPHRIMVDQAQNVLAHGRDVHVLIKGTSTWYTVDQIELMGPKLGMLFVNVAEVKQQIMTPGTHLLAVRFSD